MNLVKKVLFFTLILNLLIPKTQPAGITYIKEHQAPVTTLVKLITGCAVGYMAYQVCLSNMGQAENIRKMVRLTYQTNDFQKDFVLRECRSFAQEICNTLVKNGYFKSIGEAISFYLIHILASCYSVKQIYDLGKYFLPRKPKPTPEQALQEK